MKFYWMKCLKEGVDAGGGNHGEGEVSEGAGNIGSEMVIVDGQHRLGACAAIAASVGGTGGGALKQGLETVTVEVLPCFASGLNPSTRQHPSDSL
jgi:hypothetical protein